MKTKTITLTILLLFITATNCYVLGGTPIPVFMQWATHVDITETSTVTGNPSSDWCYSIKKSKDGGYIACGFSQIRYGTQNSPGPAIIKLDPNGNVLWHEEFDPLGLGSFGALTEIVEAPNGNLAAVGYQQTGTSGHNSAIFILTDKYGLLQNSSNMTVPNYFSYNHEEGYKLCCTPDNKFLFTASSNDGTNNYGLVEKTDGISYTIEWYPTGYFGSTEYSLENIKIGTITSSTNYDIIIGGSHVLSSTTVSGNDRNGHAISAPDMKKETDVDLYRVNYNSGTYTSIWQQRYTNSTFTPNLFYDDKGPYNPNGTTGSSCPSGVSPYLDKYFNLPPTNSAAEVLISNQPSHDIAFCIYQNLVWPNDHYAYDYATAGVDDCTRPGSVHYNELKDAQAFVLRVDYSTGKSCNHV